MVSSSRFSKSTFLLSLILSSISIVLCSEKRTGQDGVIVCFGDRMDADFAARSSDESSDLCIVLLFFCDDWDFEEMGGGRDVLYSSLGRL